LWTQGYGCGPWWIDGGYVVGLLPGEWDGGNHLQRLNVLHCRQDTHFYTNVKFTHAHIQLQSENKQNVLEPFHFPHAAKYMKTQKKNSSKEM
jgi:hypothetical protein